MDTTLTSSRPYAATSHIPSLSELSFSTVIKDPETFYSLFAKQNASSIEQRVGLQYLKRISPHQKAVLPVFTDAVDEYTELVVSAARSLMEEFVEIEKYHDREKLLASACPALIRLSQNKNLSEATRQDLSNLIHSLNEKRAFTCLDLSESDFSGLDLSGLDFSNSCFDKANLSCTTMRTTEMQDTSLCSTNLSCIDATKANFEQARMDSAVACHSTLTGANFSGAFLVCTNLRYSNLAHAFFKSFSFEKTDMTGADLYNITVYGAAASGPDVILTDVKNLNPSIRCVLTNDEPGYWFVPVKR